MSVSRCVRVHYISSPLGARTACSREPLADQEEERPDGAQVWCVLIVFFQFLHGSALLSGCLGGSVEPSAMVRGILSYVLLADPAARER